MNWLKHLIYWLRCKQSGFEPTETDDRDFDTLDIGWFGYDPKLKKKEIETLSVKNQAPNNTCTMEAGTVQKEVDERLVLSVGSAVTKQRQMGLLSGNGWAGLDGIQKVLKAWGIMEERDAPTIRSWSKLSNTPINNDKADEHKTKSYWTVNSRASRLRALDEGRVVTTAIFWYTGYNAHYLPKNALLTDRKGYKVGGHSFCIVGYDTDYEGHQVYICQNSYGEGWGDKGKFYCDMDFLDKEMYWGAYINLDIGRDTGSFIKSYAQKNVRANTGGGIYYISAGKKRVYRNMFDYTCWNDGKKWVSLSELETQTLNALPDGDNMKAEKSPIFSKYKSQLKDLSSPTNLERLLEILNKEL